MAKLIVFHQLPRTSTNMSEPGAPALDRAALFAEARGMEGWMKSQYDGM